MRKTRLVRSTVKVLAGTDRDAAGADRRNQTVILQQVAARNQQDVAVAAGRRDVGGDRQDIGRRVTLGGQRDVAAIVIGHGIGNGQRAGCAHRDLVVAAVVVCAVQNGHADECPHGADRQRAEVVDVDITRFGLRCQQSHTRVDVVGMPRPVVANTGDGTQRSTGCLNIGSSRVAAVEDGTAETGHSG